MNFVPSCPFLPHRFFYEKSLSILREAPDTSVHGHQLPSLFRRGIMDLIEVFYNLFRIPWLRLTLLFIKYPSGVQGAAMSPLINKQFVRIAVGLCCPIYISRTLFLKA